MNPADLKHFRRQLFDRLLTVKADSAVATPWKSYFSAGKGVLFLNNSNTWYFPKRIIQVRFPASIRRRLLPLVKHYDPRRQAIAAILWEDESFNVRILTPKVAPEDTFLSLVGTPLLPPM